MVDFRSQGGGGVDGKDKMVQFIPKRDTEVERPYVVSEDRQQRKLVLSADVRRVEDAAKYWLQSSQLGSYKKTRDDIDLKIGTIQATSRISADLNVFVGDEGLSRLFGDNDDSTKLIKDAVVIKIQKKDAGTFVSIDANIPQDIQDLRPISQQYDPDRISLGAYQFFKEKGKAVSLGYGPDHKLNDIQPVAVSRTYSPRDDNNLIPNFQRWLRALAQRTNANLVETGFYVDENNNSIGVLEGGKSSIMYPPTQPGQVKVGSHTHPTLKNIAFPSGADLETMNFRCNNDSVVLILLVNGSVHFTDIGKTESDSDVPSSEAVYPFDELPICRVTMETALTEGDVEDHHDSQAEKIENMVDQQIAQKQEGIRKIEDTINDPLVEIMEDEIQKSVMLEERLIDENRAIETLNDKGIDSSKKFTVEQHILTL